MNAGFRKHPGADYLWRDDRFELQPVGGDVRRPGLLLDIQLLHHVLSTLHSHGRPQSHFDYIQRAEFYRVQSAAGETGTVSRGDAFQQ